MDRETQEEVQRIVQLTAVQLELRTQKDINSLRDEVSKIPIAVAREIHMCRQEHAKGSRWGIQTFLSILALLVSVAAVVSVIIF